MDQPRSRLPARTPHPAYRPPELVHEPPRQGAEDVLRRAAELLQRQMPAFAESIIARLQDTSAYYGDPLLAPPDMRESAHTALECFVSGVISPHRLSESGEYAWYLGRKRAEEGIPLQAILHAYRIGGAETWDTLVSVVMQDCPDQVHLMAYAANDLWRRVDRDTALVIESHRRAGARLPDEDGRKRQPLLKVLLRGHADALHAFEQPVGGRLTE